MSFHEFEFYVHAGKSTDLNEHDGTPYLLGE